MSVIMTISILLVSAVVFTFVGYFIRKNIAEAKITSAEHAAQQILDEAKRNSEALKKEKLLEARDEIHKLRSDVEQEIREERLKLQNQESRLVQKEEILDRKSESLDRKENLLEE